MVQYTIIDIDDEYALVIENEDFSYSAPILTGRDEDDIITQLEKILKQVS